MKHAFLIVFCLALSGCAVTPASGDIDENLRAELARAERALHEARLLDAEILYRDLTQEHPTLPEVWLKLGNIYARQSQNAAAVRVYREGLLYQRRDARLWYNLAVVQLKQAVETLEAASRILPTDGAYRPRIRKLHRALLSASVPDADSLEQ